MAKDRFPALARMNFSSPYVALPQRLTAAENLRVYGHLYGVPVLERRIAELAEELDLGGFLARPAGELSAGQKTRVALILRHGAGAETMAWAVLFGLTPFSAVFYPVSVLPPALRVPALALPSSHVFEGMRAVLLRGSVQWGEMGWAIELNLIWMAAAMVVFARQFRAARVRGALISIGE